mmetsp:Transcript_4340/g.13965  ORF Transcript_4340/g.13965 Transcript_4340/m.13965 type:complete len:136 (-) Transcript_4340:37-444(-)
MGGKPRGRRAGADCPRGIPARAPPRSYERVPTAPVSHAPAWSHESAQLNVPRPRHSQQEGLAAHGEGMGDNGMWRLHLTLELEYCNAGTLAEFPLVALRKTDWDFKVRLDLLGQIVSDKSQPLSQIHGDFRRFLQ